MRVLCMRRGAQRDLQMASMQYPGICSSSSPATTNVVGFSSSYATTTTATAQQEELCNPRRRNCDPQRARD
ncbi:unnamed protein product [Sphagnum troendelagicum]|uniref:Uncharacterized protein n=2 Tax=Sphagnum TaxID=13804 RepID=A0ABP0V1V2_9BRYO